MARSFEDARLLGHGREVAVRFADETRFDAEGEARLIGLGSDPGGLGERDGLCAVDTDATYVGGCIDESDDEGAALLGVRA